MFIRCRKYSIVAFAMSNLLNHKTLLVLAGNVFIDGHFKIRRIQAVKPFNIVSTNFI